MLLPSQGIYHWFDSALSSDMCDRIMKRGLDKMKELEKAYGNVATQAQTTGGSHKGASNKKKVPMGEHSFEELEKKGIKRNEIYTRDSNVAWLKDEWIYEALQPLLWEANEKAGWNFDVDYCQALQFTKYGVDQFCGWHTDSNDLPYEYFNPQVHEVVRDSSGNPILDHEGRLQPKEKHIVSDVNYAGKIRKISMTCNLTPPDQYDGGNFRFDLGPHAGDDRIISVEQIRPRGSVVVFPSHVYHQVTPVTRGTRYSLVLWAMGQPFR